VGRFGDPADRARCEVKSIYFNQVPNMRGKKTMPFTDVEVFNPRERLNEAFERNQVALFLASAETDCFRVTAQAEPASTPLS
jgi:hypothetical protein